MVRFYKGFKVLILWSMFQKTKFSRNWSTILLWPIKQKMFLRALGRALYYFFSPKMIVLICLGWFLMGGAKKRNFPRCKKGAAAAARVPRMQLGSRGCIFFGADVFREPPAVPPLLRSPIYIVHASHCLPALLLGSEDVGVPRVGLAHPHGHHIYIFNPKPRNIPN